MKNKPNLEFYIIIYLTNLYIKVIFLSFKLVTNTILTSRGNSVRLCMLLLYITLYYKVVREANCIIFFFQFLNETARTVLVFITYMCFYVYIFLCSLAFLKIRFKNGHIEKKNRSKVNIEKYFKLKVSNVEPNIIDVFVSSSCNKRSKVE